jgi:tripartite-type tricarboxylate transporter receptor subunit TctC
MKRRGDRAMTTSRRFVLATVGAAGAAGALPRWARAQAGPGAAASGWKPNGPVRLLNGFSAGGAADLLCRILAEALAPALGQPVVVDTRPGANGFIAAQAVARAAPDGRTIGLATMSMLTIAPQLPGMNLPIDPRKELAPIAEVAGIYVLLVAAPDAPFRAVPELIAYAKANPGKISYASAGIGSAPHLAGELFKRQAGIDIVHVPYKGGAQAMVDLEAGRVQMLIGNMPDYLPQVKSGALRGIAFGGDRPSPALPDLPLIRQWLPRYDVSNWFGMVGPAGLPPAVIAGLNGAFQSALAQAAVRAQMDRLGAAVLSGDTAAFQALIDHDWRSWGEVITAAHIRVE